jgi:hypothetical protein
VDSPGPTIHLVSDGLQQGARLVHVDVAATHQGPDRGGRVEILVEELGQPLTSARLGGDEEHIPISRSPPEAIP